MAKISILVRVKVTSGTRVTGTVTLEGTFSGTPSSTHSPYGKQVTGVSFLGTCARLGSCRELAGVGGVCQALRNRKQNFVKSVPSCLSTPSRG